jgi:hypothetical protein
MMAQTPSRPAERDLRLLLFNTTFKELNQELY